MHEPQPSESLMAVTYYALNIGGVPQVTVDVMANIYQVQGQDLPRRRLPASRVRSAPG